MSQQVKLLTASTEGNALLPPLIRAFQRVSAAPFPLWKRAFFNSCIIDHLMKSLDANAHLTLGRHNAGRIMDAKSYAEYANEITDTHSFENMMVGEVSLHIDEQLELLQNFSLRLENARFVIPLNIPLLVTAALNFNAEQDKRSARRKAPQNIKDFNARVPPMLDIAADAHFCAHLMDYLGTRMRDRWNRPEQAAQYRNFLMLIRDKLPMTIDPTSPGREMPLTVAHQAINAMRERLRHVLRQEDEELRIPGNAFAEMRLANTLVYYASHYGEIYTTHEATPRPGNVESLAEHRKARPA